MLQKIWMLLGGMAIAIVLSITSLFQHQPLAQAASPLPLGQAAVCAIVTTMPGAGTTDEMLTLLGTDRAETVSHLAAMKTNMEQYEAEGYGWQNVIDGSGALAPHPSSWLIGALRMACEPPSVATLSGTVSYRQRIALPPDAELVVKLEDVSLADAPAVVIAETTIRTAGQQVPIPFALTYNPEQIQEQHRYAVRAQIFYGDELRWTSTQAYLVITQENPTEVAITVQPL